MSQLHPKFTCSGRCMGYYREVNTADADFGPTSPDTDLVTPDALQGSH